MNKIILKVESSSLSEEKDDYKKYFRLILCYQAHWPLSSDPWIKNDRFPVEIMDVWQIKKCKSIFSWVDV